MYINKYGSRVRQLLFPGGSVAWPQPQNTAKLSIALRTALQMVLAEPSLGEEARLKTANFLLATSTQCALQQSSRHPQCFIIQDLSNAARSSRAPKHCCLEVRRGSHIALIPVTLRNIGSQNLGRMGFRNSHVLVRLNQDTLGGVDTNN